MIEPKILLNKRYSDRQVSFQIKSKTNYKTTPQIQKDLKSLWDARLEYAKEHDILAYDGTVYRLEEFQEEGDKLIISVSELNYSQGRCFNELEYADSLGYEYYPRGLSIGGLLKTSDNKYIFGIRNEKTLTENAVDFIGGMIEKTDPMPDMTINGLLCKELNEEAHIEPKHISEINLMGIVMCPKRFVIVLTETTLNIDTQELQEIFKTRTDNEMKDFKIVEEKDLIEFLNNAGGNKPIIATMLDQTL